MSEHVPDTNENPVQTERKGRGLKSWLLIIGALIVVLPITAMFLWSVIALNYSYSNGDRAGYVQKFSKKGWVCKTWEGNLSMINIPGAAPEALAAFAAVLPEWGERFRTGSSVPALEQSRAFPAIISAATSEGPLLLVMDDAQWADRSSLLGLLALLRDDLLHLLATLEVVADALQLTPTRSWPAASMRCRTQRD